MKGYNPLTKQTMEKLKQIVGTDQVIYGDPDRLEPYSHDEIADPDYAHFPEVVLKPKNSAEIAEIMKLANAEMIPVTPRGAGSGLSGVVVPKRRSCSDGY